MGDVSVVVDAFAVINLGICGQWFSWVAQSNNVETLYICGVSTNMAVELTSREAHDRDYQVVVIGDACGSFDEETHQTALKVLTRIANIITVAELA